MLQKVKSALSSAPLALKARQAIRWFFRTVLGTMISRTIYFVREKRRTYIIRQSLRRSGNAFHRLPYTAITPRSYDRILAYQTKNYAELTNPLATYRYLVASIEDIADTRLLPLYELHESDPDGQKLIGLRHDIDANPVSALRLARILAQMGICGSFYLLHTAPYYGQFCKGIFVRNPMLTKWLQQFIVSGCELGLHNDAYGAFVDHGCNGAESVIKEIAWLRSEGAVIRGTVAHNSAPVYGAENYEIFQERILWKRDIAVHHGARLPIGLLSESELQLSYEGTFAVPKPDLDIAAANTFIKDKKHVDVRSRNWMHTYLSRNPYCDWAIDCQFWLIGRDLWVGAGYMKTASFFEWGIDTNRILEIVADIPSGSRSVFVLHPEYFDAT